MSLPDLINGLFEALGSIFVALSCIKLYKDKQVHGVSALTVGFFTSWGLWNLFYYPHLGQFWSSVAAGLVALVNAAWLGMIFYYRRYPGGRRLAMAYERFEGTAAADLQARIDDMIGNSIRTTDEELAALREALEDISKHGLRADMNPTQPVGNWKEVTIFFLDYLKRIDDSLKERARAALEGKGK